MIISTNKHVTINFFCLWSAYPIPTIQRHIHAYTQGLQKLNSCDISRKKKKNLSSCFQPRWGPKVLKNRLQPQFQQQHYGILGSLGGVHLSAISHKVRDYIFVTKQQHNSDMTISHSLNFRRYKVDLVVVGSNPPNN